MMTEQSSATTTFTTPSDLEIAMIRTFNAPRDIVFDVWTKPEHVRNWWGWKTSEMTVCDIDLRVGGSYRFVTREPNDLIVAFTGVYHEIDRPDRLIYTEIFEDYPDNPGLNTVVFEESDGKTTVICTSKYESQEVRDMVLQSGMESGASHSMDRIAEILATLV